MSNDAVASPSTADATTGDEPPSLSPCNGAPAHAVGQSSFPKVSALVKAADWNDWRWQMRHRIRSVDRLAEIFPELGVSEGLRAAAARFPLAITPYYASLIGQCSTMDPVFCMSVPNSRELWNPPFLRDDPLEEDRDMPVPGLIRRYPDRALVIATTACPMYCRHCTRKRVTGSRESRISEARLRRSVAYLRSNPGIKDVIISGGDPLTLPTDAIEEIVKAIRSVPSVEIIRIGTRTPVTLPMRISYELVAMLQRYHPLWINTHFNHPVELTADAARACGRLVDAGIPMGNQTVLLKGVNDDIEVMERLLRGLIRIRVRPYYLFQCDLVPGVEHFRTPLSKGIEIMEALRGRMSGLGIPDFVLDVPHGGGKVPLLPQYVLSSSPTHTVLRNFEGMLASYPEPYAEDMGTSPLRPFAGPAKVCDLLSGQSSMIRPHNTERHNPRRLAVSQQRTRTEPGRQAGMIAGDITSTHDRHA